MLSLKNVLPAAALLLLLNACGAAPTENSRQVNQTPKTESTQTGPQAEAPSAPGDAAVAQSGYVRVDGADGQSAFACSYSINGKTVAGKSQEECERLKKDFEKAAGSIGVPVPPAIPAPTVPAGSDNQVACAFNINGKLYEGKSQAECDKLKKDLGITMNIPTIPAPAPVIVPTPAPAPAPGTSTNVACAFNINGKLYEGKSQAECDKLKKDLGLQF
ncbi:MAG TPA: hypothetical protein VFO10_00805 [Oligoflexus sp.]|uniref:hypothetical protein n=1 Tax=Oligoflexus sp. TaxID=1971216 RepID=UPI002D7E9C5C|nr:hypothetical protein [Oligoflexus sp.]HET9235754.1 hypothetical protein [Oligoflexus sp.]